MAGSPHTRRAKGICLTLAALTVLGGGLAAPVFYESQSLYYKFGADRGLLLAGKAFGMAALVMMVWQVVLMARFHWLDRLLGIKPLFFLHKIFGVAVGVAVMVHPLLIFWSEDFTLFPFERRYWPEFLGGLALAATLILVGVSLLRARLAMPYRLWQTTHRVTAPAVVFMAFVHAGFVSGTFDHTLPRYGLAAAGGLVLVLVVRAIVKRCKPSSKP